jgi:hypothetical protein
MRTVVALACLGALAALAGCAAVSDECGTLGVADYDHAFQEKLAQELALAGPNAVWPDAISDYRALRDDVKACQQKEKDRPRVKLW